MIFKYILIGFALCLLIPGLAFAFSLTVAIFKQIRWESNLKRYRIKGPGEVVNPQGFVITSPSHLLEELKGIEAPINAKSNISD